MQLFINLSINRFSFEQVFYIPFSTKWVLCVKTYDANSESQTPIMNQKKQATITIYNSNYIQKIWFRNQSEMKTRPTNQVIECTKYRLKLKESFSSQFKSSHEFHAA